MAVPYPYPGMPQHPAHAPAPPPNVPKQEEFVQVKTRYRDQNMKSTFKMHVFAEDPVLSQLAGEMISMYLNSEVKRKQDEHCITVTKLGNMTHHAENQLFRTLSRHGFTLKSSSSSVIPATIWCTIRTAVVVCMKGEDIQCWNNKVNN